MKAADGASESVIVFDDETGDPIFPDLGGTWKPPKCWARLALAPADGAETRRAGRPKLGVVAREVTLLPRHWGLAGDPRPRAPRRPWRKLVEEACGATCTGKDRARRSLRAADRFMYRMAGDLPLFEDAYRAFYAGDFGRMDQLIAASGPPTFATI